MASSPEVKVGAVVSKVLFGRRWALFRGASGKVALVDAVCPHLGADMSRGDVCGEHLRCPFHGFEFNREGQCVDTPYNVRVPPKAKTKALPVMEREGFVFAWWDEHGREPSWRPEPLETKGWLPVSTRTFAFPSHPLSTSENSVDIAHFTHVHAFAKVNVLDPIHAEGPRLTGSYELFHWFGGRNHFTVNVWGLGYSLVENTILVTGQKLRFWVLCTPTETGHVEMRLGSSAKTDGSRASRIAARVVRDAAFLAMSREVEQDIAIWTHRTHIDRPALAGCDGPIGLYRKWARQFNPDQPRQIKTQHNEVRP